jgi:hypothetical protein
MLFWGYNSSRTCAAATAACNPESGFTVKKTLFPVTVHSRAGPTLRFLTDWKVAVAAGTWQRSGSSAGCSVCRCPSMEAGLEPVQEVSMANSPEINRGSTCGPTRPGFESHQGVRFLGSHSNTVVYVQQTKYALFLCLKR